MSATFTIPFTFLGYFFFFLIGVILAFRAYDRWSYRRMYSPYVTPGYSLGTNEKGKRGGLGFIFILAIIAFFLWLASSESTNKLSIDFDNPKDRTGLLKVNNGKTNSSASHEKRSKKNKSSKMLSDFSLGSPSPVERPPTSEKKAFRSEGMHWHLQVGAFSKRQNALRYRDELMLLGISEVIILPSQKYEHVLIGRYRSLKEANSDKKRLLKKFDFKEERKIRAVDERELAR